MDIEKGRIQKMKRILGILIVVLLWLCVAQSIIVIVQSYLVFIMGRDVKYFYFALAMWGVTATCYIATKVSMATIWDR